MKLTRAVVEDHSGAGGALLGTAGRSDPFHVRTINAENGVEEVGRSDALPEALREQGIAAVISVVGNRALSILWKLDRKGSGWFACPNRSRTIEEIGQAVSFFAGDDHRPADECGRRDSDRLGRGHRPIVRKRMADLKAAAAKH